ncbi:MAG: hypothetical protein AAFV53_41305 [Myxococcota bacterium]
MRPDKLRLPQLQSRAFAALGLTQHTIPRSGDALAGEVAIRDPIDLVTRISGAYVSYDKIPEATARLRQIFGHAEFEVLPIEALDSLPATGATGRARNATFDGLEEMDLVFRAQMRVYERAALNGTPVRIQDILNELSAL